MPRFKLTIEYTGTRYSGWQIQKNARTVAGELERAIREVTGAKKLELYGSGRTDAGVHALAQVAHLDVATTLPADTLAGRVNDELPSDIHILKIETVGHRFHARHDAIARRYLYQISKRRTAFQKPFVWWVRDDLEVDRMRAAAAHFTGLKDFRSFTDADPDEKSTTVKVDRIDISEESDLILVRIEGSHFLWKMVRRIVGVLVEVGRGGLSVEEAVRFLTEPSGTPSQLTAPASGLFLERVLYPSDSLRAGRERLVD